MFQGSLSGLDDLRPLIERESVLGGSSVEGIVVKNYSRYTSDIKAMLGKFVRADFAEINAENWRKINPSQGDVITNLVEALRTEARWSKAVQHLRDNGELTDSGNDIPALYAECASDTKRETEEFVKEALYAWAWPKVERGVLGGMADWYKTNLKAGLN